MIKKAALPALTFALAAQALAACADADAQTRPACPAITLDANTITPAPWARDPRYAEIILNTATGEILYGENTDAPRYIASLTKVMTLRLVFEALESGALSLDQELIVSRHAAAQPSNVPLNAGDRISVRDAINGAKAQSSNNMAVALAEAVAGSEAAFAQRMTAEAHTLGATSTQFGNASGFTVAGATSTAHDIALIMAATARDYPELFAEFFSAETLPVNGDNIYNCRNCGTNGWFGEKGGFTNAAGQTLAVITTQGPENLVYVTLGVPTPGEAGRVLRAERVLTLVHEVERQNPQSSATAGCGPR